MQMRSVALLIIILSYCASSFAEVASFNPWIITKIENFKEKSQIPGEDADRTAVIFGNGKRLIIPLVNAKAIAVLKGPDETYFLFASGTDCWHCDENIGLRFYKLDGQPLTEAKKRYTYPGRLYDYEDPKSLQQETRAFFGNCLNESNEAVIWFLKYLGDDSKWHTSNTVARFSKSGDELVDLNPKDASLASVLGAVKRGICKELPGVDGTTEP
jgi:hypothetical protein